MRGWLVLVLAFLVDLAMGDPAWLPHPVRMMGKGIIRCERRLRRRIKTAAGEKRAGVLLVIMIVAPSFIVTFVVQKMIAHFSGGVLGVIGAVLIVYLVATTIAMRFHTVWRLKARPASAASTGPSRSSSIFT